MNVKHNGYIITHYTSHSCGKPIIIERSVIDEVVKRIGWKEHLDQAYMNEINDELNLPPDMISKQRIRRSFNRVFQLSRKSRLETWGKLPSLIDTIKRSGGQGIIHKDKEGFINFIGIVPNYSISFMNSSLFFQVVQLDSRFQTCIAKGRLYGLITSTGDRSILPLAYAWAESEKSIYTNMLFQMLNDDVHLIKTCHTDEAYSLISCVENFRISNALCTWHISKHCPKKFLFNSLVNSETSSEYFKKKDRILKSNNSLAQYLNKKKFWSKISRFESNAPRDQKIASSSVESFNSMIARMKLKNKEPLDVMMHIYDIGYFCLKNICTQKNDLVNSAQDWLGYALNVANFLTVSRDHIFTAKYYVTKENDKETRLTVMIQNNELPTCTCKFFHDCGMPCSHILAVACKYNMNWTNWVHPRYFTSNYRLHFENVEYPDFDCIFKVNDDGPRKAYSLKQRQKRIATPGDVKQSKKAQKK